MIKTILKQGIRLRGAALTLCVAVLSTGAMAATLQYDIVVNGGSFSAVAAALAAARDNPTAQVLLIEPTDWVGGQATSQGVSAIDNTWFAPAATIMRDNPTLYYAADYLDFLNRLKTAPPAAPGEGFAPNGTGWVTREAFDPRTAVWALDAMLAERSNLTVKRMTVVKNVTTAAVSDANGSGSKITGLTLIERTAQPGYTPSDDFLSAELPDWYSATDSARFTKQTHTVTPLDGVKGLVVIDASENADVIVLSGAKYTQGRETSTEKVAEDGTLPAANDLQSQAIVYPFCMTDAAAPDAENDVKAPWADFATFYADRAANFYSIGGYSWAQVWTYRRIRLGQAPPSTTVVNAGDVSMQNWNPGNDFPFGSWLLSKSAAAAQAADWQGGVNLTTLADSEKHAVGWYFWMKNNRTTTWDTRLARGADAYNMMGTKHGLAKYPYIRCGRRLVGLDNFRITGRYWKNTLASGYANETSFRFFDSVGIGNYAADVHGLSGGSGMAPPFERPAPFYIPYRALGSHNVRNLLAAGKTMAQTYVSNSAYRLHPIEWASGSAAGAAAALMFRDGKTNYALLQITALRELQNNVAANSPIRWTYRSEPVIPPMDGDLVVNNFQNLTLSTAFDVEAYHPTAVRADIYMDGSYLGQTTTRANGRLLYQNVGVASAPNPCPFEARLFDGSNNQIAVLTATIPTGGVACSAEPGVSESDDPNYFSTTGTWTVGNSQANRWCSTGYSYKFGNTGAGTATFKPKTTVPGIYQLFIWYPESSNRAVDAPFTINHADGSTVVTVNQRINGGQWFSLGNYKFINLPTESIVLSNQGLSDTTKLVVADALKVTLVSPIAHVEDWQKLEQ